MSRRPGSLPIVDDVDPGRRAFLSRVWTGLGVVASAELVCAAGGYLASRPDDAAQGAGLVEAGQVGAFAPGSVHPFPQWKLYLVRLGDGGFLALSSRCTHLGCTVGWDEQRQTFPCPCHGSTFDLRGDVIGPPALRALDFFPVSVEGGVVKVDTSQPRRRSGFDPGQVAYV